MFFYLKKIKPQSSSIWIYNATIFSSKSILNRIFLFIFFILELFLLIVCFNSFLIFTNLSALFLIYFYILLSVFFFFYGK